MSNSDRSRSPVSHRSRATPARPELPGFPLVCSYGLSCPNIKFHAAPSDHPQMARHSVGTLWVVSTSDGFSTYASLRLDQCSSFSTISTAGASSTKHSCHTIFDLPSDTALSIHTQHAHQSIPIQLTVRSQTSSTLDRLARRQRPLRQPEDQRLDPSTHHSFICCLRLEIEGCDPLALPLAALLYQQANNHWLRKLAHGREMYLIPTGDIVHDGVASSVEKPWSRP